MDHLDLGSAPSDEDCASVGEEGYTTRARRECRALIGHRIASNPNDFGAYYSVVVEYDGNDAEAAAYAQHCDEETPDVWDMAARLELDAARQKKREVARPARKSG